LLFSFAEQHIFRLRGAERRLAMATAKFPQVHWSNTVKKFLTVAIAVLAALSLASSAQASTASHREALEAAQSYLRSGHFSKAGLIEQLESPYGENFTHAQAVYGVSKAYR
jgi:hypothetical protein